MKHGIILIFSIIRDSVQDALAKSLCMIALAFCRLIVDFSHGMSQFDALLVP